MAAPEAYVWLERIEAWKVSGQSCTNYARQNGWPLSTFKIWIRRLNDRCNKTISEVSGILPVRVVNTPSKLMIQSIAPASLERLILKSASSWHLEIPAATSTKWLAELLKELS